MQGKRWLAIVVIFVSAVSGCREPNPYHCPDGELCPPAGGPCTSSGECRAPTPVCDEANMACVECLQSADCAMGRPICSAENTCIECAQNADCASGLCLPEGACADPADVAHVGGPAATDNSECSLSMPCRTLQQALTVVPARPYIRATGAISEPVVTLLDRRSVSIIGEPGMTTITRVGGAIAPVLTIRHDSVVNLVDLEIVGGPDGHVVEIRDVPGPIVSMTRVKVRGSKDNGIQLSAGKLTLTDSEVSNATLAGINVAGGWLVMIGSQVFDNQQDGVSAAASALVEIRRSSITGNRGTAGVYTVNASMVTIESSIITRNIGTNGGVSIIGPLSIKNSIISGNGDAAATVGGLNLNSNSAIFEFNTVADNISNSTPSMGMGCVVPLNVSNSILTGNLINGCNVTYSLADTALSGVGNKMGAPMFLSTDAANPLSPTFYRIGPASSARDSADPAATLDVDIDGQPRTDGRRDMGADEFN